MTVLMEAIAGRGSGVEQASARFSLSVENKRADPGRDGTRETELSGANRDREIPFSLFS